MEFSQHTIGQLQAHTQQHVTQQGFPYKVTGTGGGRHTIDVTLMDPAAHPARGIVLRLTEDFLRFSDQHRVFEVLEQQASYFCKQGLQEQEGDNFPVILIRAP
ncbi:hypothetical protein [Deinococcus roseus]|uniref:Uncharacterized protein n=1 Tax=Deinococcus roseus TaxID=392414 RepID=A0ABQ2DIF6_9DEIO|nr:hypothetical protein [Deinococcus roseus]GGJ56731.1 hypothetical protein GCM10008938_48580 [Deinococcus roseus]